ncbi:MAG: DMT family transporter [Rhodospirillales bacterium]|nr:DMT family transporter [Rhodospirillales bacterium]
MTEPSPSSAAPHARATVSPATAYLFITATVFFWSIGIVIGRGVHGTIPPVGLSFWRWFIAAMMLLPFVWKDVVRCAPLIKQSFGMLSLQGALLLTSSTLLFVAVNFTTAINAALLNATQPTMTALMVWIVVREKMGMVQVFGIIAAMAGVLTMVSGADWRVVAGLDFNIGDLLVVLATVGYAIYAINLRKIPGQLGVPTALFVILSLGSFLILPFYVGETIFIRAVPFDETLFMSVFVLSLFTSVFALLMWNAGNHAVGPNRAAIFLNAMPVFSSALAIVFLGEQLYFYHFIGAVLVAVGILLVVRK